jgi:hypothetical protein
MRSLRAAASSFGCAAEARRELRLGFPGGWAQARVAVRRTGARERARGRRRRFIPTP